MLLRKLAQVILVHVKNENQHDENEVCNQYAHQNP
jgi:hypothetical protein